MNIKALISAIGAGALQFMLEFISYLKLEPLAAWGWDDNFIAITYLISMASAVISYIYAAKNKIFAISIGIVILLSSFVVYTYASNTPPFKGSKRVYDIYSYISFFLTYIAFGYLVGHITKVFLPK